VRVLILGALLPVAGMFVRSWARSTKLQQPRWRYLVIGFGTNFLDTLGIGSFATTTSLFKLWRAVPDELIPGTLNVGHALPTVAQALIFITLIQVEAPTLFLMIMAAVIGAMKGADVVSRLSRRRIQITVAAALVVAAVFLLLDLLDTLPIGGEERGLRDGRLAGAVFASLVLGALVTAGVGSWAPTLALVSLLGMEPRGAFPIMMGSAAFLMPLASLKFLERRRYHESAAVGLAVGGVPAVLIAGLLVKSLPIDAMRWIVLAVVVYTARVMMRSAMRERPSNQDRVGRSAADGLTDEGSCRPSTGAGSSSSEPG
jgi:uncharacterized membrane protein YfcA